MPITAPTLLLWGEQDSYLSPRLTEGLNAWVPNLRVVRFPDVSVRDVDRCVDQATLREIESVRQHCGHAGPAFVQALIDEGLHRDAEALLGAAGVMEVAVLTGFYHTVCAILNAFEIPAPS